MAAESRFEREIPLRKPPATTFAGIDVGTNSIHFVLAEISPEGDFQIVDRDKDMVQLGKGGFTNHQLNEEAIHRGLEALKRFRRIALSKHASKIKVIATSAVREAHNGGDFVKRVAEELDLDVQVISCEEEGRLIYLGVRHAVDMGQRPHLIIDVGGGSVELVVGNAEKPSLIESFKLGGARTAELFLRHDPPGKDEIAALRKHIRKQLGPTLERIRQLAVVRCIATSGTLKHLATLAGQRRQKTDVAAHPGLLLRRAEITDLADALLSVPRKERLKLPGLDPRRVNSCPAAAVLLTEIVKALSLEEITHCDLALREGLLVDYIGRHCRKLVARATWPDPRPRSVIYLAERCGYRQAHAEQICRLSLTLFDDLADLHEAPETFRELLGYAALLHDIGYHISHTGHHKHSYYLIRHGRLNGFEDHEIEVIANLARYHRKDRPKKTHHTYQQLRPEDRGPVRKLSVLLRVADALDRTRYGVVRSLLATEGPDTVDVLIQTDRDAELEIWSARQHAPLFERELDRALVIHLPAEMVGEESGAQRS